MLPNENVQRGRTCLMDLYIYSQTEEEIRCGCNVGHQEVRFFLNYDYSPPTPLTQTTVLVTLTTRPHVNEVS